MPPPTAGKPAVTVVGVNGIATHGDANIDLMLLELDRRGVPTLDVRLPKRHWFSARWGGRGDGRHVARCSSPGDILLCHSYGAVRAWHAHQYRDYSAIVLIAPAHGRDVEWKHPNRVFCYYSTSDWAVRIGSRLLFHPFGRAGVEGYSHPEIHNTAMHSSHSDYFDMRLRMFGQIIDQVQHLHQQATAARNRTSTNLAEIP